MNSAQPKERVSPAELERAQRTDLAALVSRDGMILYRDGTWLAGLCPFHKEKTPSFKIKDGRFKCFGCGASGDAIEYVQRSRKLEFVEAIQFLAGPDSAPRLRVVSRRKRPELTSGSPEVIKARGIWRQTIPVACTPVENYMRSRGLSTFPESVGIIPRYNWFSDVVLPVMVVAVQGPTGHLIAVQLTALTLDGSRKAFGDRSRRTEGILAAGAARFAPAGEVLGLAEGTEKGIAAQELTGIPCWASLGAQRMPSVIIPEVVGELHIFADDDTPGREWAEKTAERHKRRRVVVRYAPDGFKDWDEILLARRCA